MQILLLRPHKIEIPMLIYVQVPVEIMNLKILHVSGQKPQNE